MTATTSSARACPTKSDGGAIAPQVCSASVHLRTEQLPGPDVNYRLLRFKLMRRERKNVSFKPRTDSETCPPFQFTCCNAVEQRDRYHRKSPKYI